MPTSLNVYLPFDSGAGANITEDQWRKMALHWVGTGPLDGEDNELEAYGDSSGMQVKVKTGKCFVRGHYGENTTEKTLAISAVGGIPGGQSRLDRVVLRADFTNDRIEVDVLTGTPAATGSQVAPSLTQSATMWEVSLATVGPLTNATTTIAAGDVTDTRTLIQAPSSINTRGRVASTKVTSNSVAVDDSPEVTLATVTATLATGRKGKLSACWKGFVASVDESAVLVRLYQGATQVAEQAIYADSANINGGGVIFAVVDGDGASTAYELRAIRLSATGTFTFQADATDPTTLLLEDIGT